MNLLFLLIAIIYLGIGVIASTHMHDNSKLYYRLTDTSCIFTWLLYIGWFPAWAMFIYHKALKQKSEKQPL